MKVSRVVKITKIAQAHVAPGMSAERLQDILARHNLTFTITGLEQAPEQTLDLVIAEISQIVKESQS